MFTYSNKLDILKQGFKNRMTLPNRFSNFQLFSKCKNPFISQPVLNQTQKSAIHATFKFEANLTRNGHRGYFCYNNPFIIKTRRCKSWEV